MKPGNERAQHYVKQFYEGMKIITRRSVEWYNDNLKIGFKQHSSKQDCTERR